MMPHITPAQITLTKATCYCEGGCAPAYQVSFQTRGGNQISVTGPFTPNLACQTGVTSNTWLTFDTGDADRIIPANFAVYTSIETAPVTADRLTVCFQYVYGP